MAKKKESVEQTVRNIRRKTRKQYSSEEKIRIVLEGLRGESTVAELCRREGIAQSLYYKWSKEFLEAGKQRLAGNDVEETLELALEKSGLEKARVRHRPRLLSDNGPAYLSKELKRFLKRKDIEHIRGAPYHPMTQGKIERYHRSLKNIVKLQHCYSPSQLTEAIDDFVEYYNNQRYHESLDNMTPAVIFYGKEKEVQSKREKIKRRTMALRRLQNLVPVGV